MTIKNRFAYSDLYDVKASSRFELARHGSIAKRTVLLIKILFKNRPKKQLYNKSFIRYFPVYYGLKFFKSCTYFAEPLGEAKYKR